MSRRSTVPILLPLDPVQPLEAATKQYVDTFARLRQPIVTTPSISYSLTLSDEGAFTYFTGATATTMFLPTSGSQAFPIGCHIDFAQVGAGKITVTPAGGVTLYATPSTVLRAQGSAATLIKLDTNTWILVGDLA